MKIPKTKFNKLAANPLASTDVCTRAAGIQPCFRSQTKFDAMATPTTTLDSFVAKFKQLWLSGSTANFTVETNAGKAWVCLRAELSQPQAQAVHRQHQERSRNGPSRQRRRARRAAERAATVDVATRDEPVTDDLNEDCTSNASVTEATVTKISSEQVYHVDTDDDDLYEAEEASNSENGIEHDSGEILLPFSGKLLPITNPTISKPPSPKPSTFPSISPSSDPPDAFLCCGDCRRPFGAQAKPTQCQKCAKTFHKTRCLKSHHCMASLANNSKSHNKAPTQHEYQQKESDLFSKIFT